MLRKQRLQSAEGTIISLCQSETLNWICSLNSLYNFVSHVGSAESIALHLGHSNPDRGIIPFFPPFFYFFFFLFASSCLSFLVLVLLPFFLLSFSFTGSCSLDLFHLKWPGCIVLVYLVGLLKKLSCLPSQRNTGLSIDCT